MLFFKLNYLFYACVAGRGYKLHFIISLFRISGFPRRSEVHLHGDSKFGATDQLQIMDAPIQLSVPIPISIPGIWVWAEY